ncbi:MULTISPECIES: hypothetical protein [Enterobacter cloacae complex]|uniref:hypothetical protein n=1 Tax=Enterobacter cloacae complex TaxID=354276 RepID=UPI0012B8A4BD|nr:hypothetical protein [Enterobacter hormaechei]MCL8179625.1 hypothetical protein [Enterobacter hormaechei]MCM7040700.1 hypothetical protein [Enterobacter hormaechei]MCM7465089.1 hypothetical protein [Enterobacter hormaechei]MCW4692529.1 hypothetical protein [Enterobacter hormaechei subsp. hoffmannii]MCW4697053.1 hypothetical protein [Enterobacter hormaechei subsp. hoffmannii]
MTDKYLSRVPVGEFPLFQSSDSGARDECCFLTDTLCLTQPFMAELYDKKVSTINEELINIIAEVERAQNTTIRKSRMVCQEGKRRLCREIEHYKGV